MNSHNKSSNSSGIGSAAGAILVVGVILIGFAVGLTVISGGELRLNGAGGLSLNYVQVNQSSNSTVS